MKNQIFIFFSFLFLFSIAANPLSAQTDPNQPNILLVIADDMGTDYTPGFLDGQLMPTTPFLDQLRADGISFKNCWATPQCTPSRAAIISGKHGIKTGIQQPPGNLDLIHTSVFNELSALTNDAYDQALIGKWHISSPNDPNHPAQHGLDYFSGIINGVIDDYYDWTKVETGSMNRNITNYITSELTDDAVDWINGRNDPWMMFLSHIAPHSPVHLPPADLYHLNATGTDRRKYIAAIEAMDTELQRLVNSIPSDVLANTIILFIGDNGTPSGYVQNYPSGRGKGNIYQGGVNVPLIVAGPLVTRVNESEDALINVTDIFATILEMAGASLPGGKHNSYSFFDFLSDDQAVGRPYNYTDYESNNSGGDEFAIRDEQYKLIQFADGTQEFYDLSVDTFELNDLMLGTLSTRQQNHFEDLSMEAYLVRTDWSCRDLIQNGNETSIDMGGTYCDAAPVCVFDNSTNRSNIGCCDSPNGINESYEIEFEDERIISTNNFPNHDFCYNSNNQIPNPTNHVFFMDREPAKEPRSSSILTATGRPSYLFGIGMNGVIMAPAPATPFIFENSNTGEYNWNWVFEPTNNQGQGMNLVGLDCASAHTNTNGHGYHYHGNMYEYVETIAPGISSATTPPAEPLQIGWAADGYPILYRFGPDGNGGLSMLEPSFELKSGDRPGDGVTAPCGPYNGKYTNDYIYTPTAGELDECNGITRDITLMTTCGPQTFDYFYMVTDSFPQIGRCHVGNRNESFNSGAETDCLVRMETQEFALNNGVSISVGNNTYDQIGIYRDTLMGSNACDSIVITKIVAVLPLKLVSFEAINRNDVHIDLLWESTNEINVSHFEIEKSDDAISWDYTAKVEAIGNTSSSHFYQYQDEWPSTRSKESVYYRLKIIDLDGSHEYSNIKVVHRTNDSTLDIIYDRNQQSIFIESSREWTEVVQVSILDLSGRLIQSDQLIIKEGRQLGLDLDALPFEIFIIQLSTENEILYSKRILATR